jgi:arginine utilization regulatory protein
LLRAIQEKSIRRIGDTKDKKIDVRIIATINEDPIDAISKGRLRKDLYYRLSVVSIFIPPLRERKEDIPLLVNAFVEKYNQLFGMNVKGVSDDVLELFLDYDWPGNVRELEHVIEGAMNLIEHEETITFSHLPFPFRKKSILKEENPLSPSDRLDMSANRSKIKQLSNFVEEAEKFYIEKVLKWHDNNITKTAKALGISRQSLQYRLRKYQLKNMSQD